MTNIILCGGSGTRLWPLSRTLMPKQFVKLFDNKSLFELTIERNIQLCDKSFIISNVEQYFLALDQLTKEVKFLLEPIGRNTAPAIALACFALDAEELVLVTPSDHLIKNKIAYFKAVEDAKKFAQEDKLVTFGITPTFAEIGFGYIEADNMDTTHVKAFHEKPNLSTATAYVASGNYFWNSGMFCFKAGIFLEELKKYAKEIYNSALLAYGNANKEEMIRIGYDDMAAIPDDSIDYAVMEKSTKVKVIASDIGWSDVGSFDALAKELPNDENNNFILSNKRVELIEIKDSIIIDTGDALLVAKKGTSQRVKEVVQRLKREKSELPNVHLTGHRPWGNYTILEEDDGYKIKRIVVQQGKRLSLQKHYHRNEHWIVLSGSATVTVNEKVFLVNPNESTYIKAGDVHRLANHGKLPLVMIEVQVGEYTGEDDIVRIEDDYWRHSE
jgi:mannose-1-phosphate guanylyltransferase